MGKYRIKVYRQIIVRLPNWLGDIALSVPALSQLEQLADDIPITVIGKQSLLPLIGQIFPRFHREEISDKYYNNLLHIRQFCRRIKKQERAIYFTLTPSFLSAYMGWVLKGRGSEVVGYRGRFRSCFLTRPIDKPENLHRSQEYIHLIRSFDLLSIDEKKDKINYARYFKNPPPHGLKKKQYIVINVNSEASSRRLPLSGWEKLIAKLCDHELVFIGSKKEQEFTTDIIRQLNTGKILNLAGKTDIIQLAELLIHAKCLITNDSGPAHLGSLVSCPTVVFFGAGDERSTGPVSYYGEVVVVREDVACSPCLKNKCPLKTLDCLKAINMDRVFLEIKNLTNCHT